MNLMSLIKLVLNRRPQSIINIIRNRSTESSPELPIPKLTAIGWRSTHSHENRKQLQTLFYLKLFPGDTSTQAASWSSWKVNLCRREKRLRGVNRRLAMSSPQYLFSSFHYILHKMLQGGSGLCRLSALRALLQKNKISEERVRDAQMP